MPKREIDDWQRRWRRLLCTVVAATVVALALSAIPTSAVAVEGTATISGTITDASKSGRLGTLIVHAQRQGGNAGQLFYVAEDGSYSIAGLEAGSYKVQVMDWTDYFLDEYYGESFTFEGARDITLAAGEVISNVDIDIERSAVLTGRFVGPDGAAIDRSTSWIVVRAYDTDGVYVGGAYTDDDNSFTLGEVPTGRYRLAFFDNGCRYETVYSGGTQAFTESSLVDVRRGEVLDIGRVELSPTDVGCPPDEIQTPVVTTDGPHVTATWTNQQQQGSPPATGYSVTSLPTGAGCSTTGPTSCVVAGMTPGVDYRLFVFGTNTAGWSLPGQPSEVFRLPGSETQLGPSRDVVGKKQRARKPPKRVRRGTSKKLAKRSNAGVKLRWTTITPKKCVVAKRKVRGKRSGECRLRVTAKAQGDWLRYEATRTVRIR